MTAKIWKNVSLEFSVMKKIFNIQETIKNTLFYSGY